MDGKLLKKRSFVRNVIVTILPSLSIIFLILLWLYASKINEVLVPSPLLVFERFLKTFRIKISGQ